MENLLDHIENYIKFIEQSNFAKNTIINYEISCRYLYSFLNHHEIDYIDIKGSEMVKLRNSMSKYASSTINARLSAIRNFYDYLIDIDIVKSNPVRNSLFIRHNRIKPKPLSDYQVNLLYNFLEGKFEHVRLAFETLIESGIRLSELTELDDNSFVEINNKYYIEIFESKNNSNRIVPISSILFNKIKNYIESNNYFFGKIFTLSHRGYQYHADQFAEKFNINFSVHSCRHTFATNMARKDIKIEHIQKMLGHKNIQTTMYYVQLSDSDILNLNIYD